MKYRKVIIDGKEYLEIIDEDKKDDTEAPEGETLECDIDDAGEPTSGEKFKRDAQEFFTKVGEGARDIGVKIGTGAKRFGVKVARDVKDAGRKIKEGAERLFAKDKTSDPDSKESRLIRLLPYMSKSETHEVAELILADDEVLKGVDLSAVLPFLSKEDSGRLFLRAVELDKKSLDIGMIVQYIDKGLLTEIVDGYLEGKYPKLDIDSLYPFLSDEDIKRIFFHIVGK